MILPVIERELRSAARQPFTHTMRILAVSALLVVLGLFGLSQKTGAGVGGEWFAAFHQVLFWAIWLLVPAACADCLSRERREGTLVLLFLTPLTSRDIVHAKSLAHGLRALTLWLTVIPVLTVCFVAGGVGWSDVLASLLLNLSSIWLAMAAGLAASALCTAWSRALGLAYGLAFIFLLGLSWASAAVVMNSAGIGGGVASALGFVGRLDMAFTFLLYRRRYWQPWPVGSGAIPPTAPAALLWGYVVIALLALLLLLFIARFCAGKVKRSLEEHPPSPQALWLKEKLFKPVFFPQLLGRWLRWQLRHNPIGWLEQRSWSGRLVIWSWFAIVVCVYSSLFSNFGVYQRGFHRVQVLLATLLTGSMAFCAAGSFRRERESGVLELLLVTPLRERQILLGRLRGLWTQFAPAIVLLYGVWLYGSTFMMSFSALPAVLLHLIAFATIPVVGLYYSLAKNNFLAAFLWTLGIQMILPALVEGAFRTVMRFPFPPAWVWTALPFFTPAWQLLIALFLGRRLHANLKHRRFGVRT